MNYDRKNDLFTLSYSWELAMQERSCPPPDVLFSGESSPELEAHLRLCPMCRKRFEEQEGEEAFETLVELMNSGTPMQTPDHAPGQLWRVQEAKGGWTDDGYHNNAPLVMILEVFDYHAVRVAQVSHYLAFVGEDDVLTGPPYDGFVEPWNVYSLPVTWLDRYAGNMGEEVAKRALEAYKSLEQNPKPLEMKLFGTPRDSFRQLEQKHSLHFSQPASVEVDDLEEEQQQEKKTSIYSTAIQAVLRKFPRVRDFGTTARMHPQKTVLALAASLLLVSAPLFRVIQSGTLVPSLIRGGLKWSLALSKDGETALPLSQPVLVRNEDKVRLTLKSESDCFVYIVGEDTQQAIHAFSNGRLRTGEAFYLDLLFEPPSGRDLLHIIVSTEELTALREKMLIFQRDNKMENGRAMMDAVRELERNAKADIKQITPLASGGTSPEVAMFSGANLYVRTLIFEH